MSLRILSFFFQYDIFGTLGYAVCTARCDERIFMMQAAEYGSPRNPVPE
jgi:hypothetical protein